jgi:hypothetical protein
MSQEVRVTNIFVRALFKPFLPLSPLQKMPQEVRVTKFSPDPHQALEVVEVQPKIPGDGEIIIQA